MKDEVGRMKDEGGRQNHKLLLRPLDFQPVVYQGQDMWLLRDPLQLTSYQLIMPPAMAQMLMFLDGTRTPEQVHADFCRHVGQPVDFAIIEEALAQLDEACLLQNQRAQEARYNLLAEYRAQSERKPTLAGLGYPADAQELDDLFAGYADGDDLSDWEGWHGRAVVSPHIDYQRGGPVYAKVWRRARTAVLEADMTLIFGTDHNGGPGSITLTRLPYATPYGVLPTHRPMIDRLANAIGANNAFGRELNHRQEHSVELSAVWLHHIYRQANAAPRPMIPILVGSFQRYIENGSHPADDPKLTQFIDALRWETAGKKVLAVASVDLAHVGPNFGDYYEMNDALRAELRQEDERIMAAIRQGDAASFYHQIAGVKDRNRICGLSSIYLMLRFLGEQASGVQVAYDQCPADAENTSVVSICGLLLE